MTAFSHVSWTLSKLKSAAKPLLHPFLQGIQVSPLRENPQKYRFQGQNGHILKGPIPQPVHKIFFEDPPIFHPYIDTFQKIWVLITAENYRTQPYLPPRLLTSFVQVNVYQHDCDRCYRERSGTMHNSGEMRWLCVKMRREYLHYARLMIVLWICKEIIGINMTQRDSDKT